MKYLIIILTYNERENIGRLLDQIKELSLPAVDFLVVDDNSPDQTAAVVKEKQISFPNLFILERSKKMGLGSAYLAGFAWGLKHGYDVLIQMDADLSHQPQYLPALIREIKNYDFVIGSRYVRRGGVENWGIGRRWLSAGGNLYARLILGTDIKDLTGGFNAWRAAVLKKIGLDNIHSNGYSFQIELKYRARQNNFTYREIPIIFTDRLIGQSKMDRHVIKEALWRIIYLRWQNLFSPGRARKRHDSV